MRDTRATPSRVRLSAIGWIEPDATNGLVDDGDLVPIASASSGAELTPISGAFSGAASSTVAVDVVKVA